MFFVDLTKDGWGWVLGGLVLVGLGCVVVGAVWGVAYLAEHLAWRP